jgi:outer membrane lipoprotein-sorting protein
MCRKTIAKITLGLLLMGGNCWAGASTESSATCGPKETDVNSVDAILEQLRQRTAKLASYQAEVEYRYVQPLLESESLRKGALSYAKFGNTSKLRVNFETLKQDDEAEQKYIEHFVFDGVWLTHIDFQTKAIKRYQLVEPNSPVDAFELASRNLPMVGFTKVEDLRKQFEISFVKPERDRDEDQIRLHLKTRPASIYKDRYASIDFWIDKKLGLPTKVVAVSTEPEAPFADTYQIRLLKPKVNQKIDEKVFEFVIPKGFGEPEIVPLKKKSDRS